MIEIRRHDWGFSVWRKEGGRWVQFGICTYPLNYFQLHGLTEPTDRIWLKRGVYRMVQS